MPFALVMTAGIAIAYIAASGCAHQIEHRQMVHKTVTLTEHRFVGPVQVPVPERPAPGRQMVVELALTAACTPRLAVTFPDGEQGHIGSSDRGWQELLARRAEAPAEVDDPAAPGASTDANPDPAPTGPGSWQQTVQERYPGQLAFEAERQRRCSTTHVYNKRYRTGYFELDHISVFAEVPQEIANATLTVRVLERIDVTAERERGEAEIRATRKAERDEQRRAARAKAAFEARAEIRVRPRPPKPAPKNDRPNKANAAGALWVSGEWRWVGSRGKWVWVRGYWRKPARGPARRHENHGSPPVAGCTWSPGYWVWQRGDGRWQWKDGHWLAPPPVVEDRGTPQVPEQEWIAGGWIRVSTREVFRWRPGQWGRPRPRAEPLPAPPFKGAHWTAGVWLEVNGRWKWSPGFYDRKGQPPPPRRREVAGASPGQGAVWLAGFYRRVGSKWAWVRGHWELPPGVGYVWVPAPVDPVQGVSIGGQWKLRVDVNVKVPTPTQRRRR